MLRRLQVSPNHEWKNHLHIQLSQQWHLVYSRWGGLQVSPNHEWKKHLHNHLPNNNVGLTQRERAGESKPWRRTEPPPQPSAWPTNFSWCWGRLQVSPNHEWQNHLHIHLPQEQCWVDCHGDCRWVQTMNERSTSTTICLTTTFSWCWGWLQVSPNHEWKKHLNNHLPYNNI